MKQLSLICLLPGLFLFTQSYFDCHQASAGSNCDAAYPGICIPSAPPDLDCGDISYKRFKVLPPDPHGFDADGDGIGCER